MDIRVSILFAPAIFFAAPALAGPPYVTDDPEPTDYQHFEIYAFMDGTAVRGGRAGETGIDFNYGGAPNLQLSTVIGLSYTRAEPRSIGGEHNGIHNIRMSSQFPELAPARHVPKHCCLKRQKGYVECASHRRSL